LVSWRKSGVEGDPGQFGENPVSVKHFEEMMN